MTQDKRQAKGSLRTDQDQLIFDEGFSFSGYERDPLYLNLGRELPGRLRAAPGSTRSATAAPAVFADFDNDGDLDVFMTTIQGQSHLLFRNNVGQDDRWLRVVLERRPRAGPGRLLGRRARADLGRDR